MAFLRRISDNLWSYVSPRKSDNVHLPTPSSEPVFKKPAIPIRRTSIQEMSRQARSMSPNERIGSWQVQTPSSQASSVVSKYKRKRQNTTSPSAARRRKKAKSGDEEAEDDFDSVMNDDYSNYDETEYGDDVQEESSRSRGRRQYRSSPSVFSEEDLSMNTTLIVEDEFAEPPSRRVVIDVPEQHKMRQISDDELREQGWDDDYITLTQKIAMRGLEPLLPSYLSFAYRWLPSELFEAHDDAFIGSVRGDHFKASKELELLLALGGHVRDRIEYPCRVSPERQMRRRLRAYAEWARKDANLDKRTAIPLLALHFQRADAPELIERATKKCRRLAARYREAFQVHRSVEQSPGSDGTLLSYPLPTFYAIIGSHDKLALMAYDPKKGPDELCSTIALFDFEDVGYDVWNSLALAITVCHARNVQMAIAEDTGIGLKQPGHADDEMDVDDPDA